MKNYLLASCDQRQLIDLKIRYLRFMRKEMTES